MEKSELEVGVTGDSNGLNTTKSPGEGSLQSLDPRIVSKLRRKMDFILLPTLALMYTFK